MKYHRRKLDRQRIEWSKVFDCAFEHLMLRDDQANGPVGGGDFRVVLLPLSPSNDNNNGSFLIRLGITNGYDYESR